ncbi:MAG: lytic transglycosylase domain-containing protein [Candidatus Sungbacteria bacterium]|nr:lytic transglycosylase domain-containing protein [Candidatus Sungbacteria bacterium]
MNNLVKFADNTMLQTLRKPVSHKFTVSHAGLVAIILRARCRSRDQTTEKTDENLRVEINGLRFREFPPEKYVQLFNIPPACNGAELKGLQKTIVFFTILEQGEHVLDLVPQPSATIEGIEIRELNGQQQVMLSREEQAEDGDRRPWFTFAFIDLSLQSFSIDASVRWRWRDGDDIKLVIDGEVQKNTSLLSVLHRNWLWSSFPFQNERQEKIFSPALPKGIHYIELWADRTPTLHHVKFNLHRSDAPASVNAKVVWESVKLRAAPHTTPEDLGSIPKNERVSILKKAVMGERIANDNGVPLSTNRWHKVKYGNQEGYIYALALEIDGEDRQTIQQIIIKEARTVNIDPEILLALADCESNMLPYTVSFQKGKPEVAYGIMQLTKELLTDLNDKSKSFYSPVDDVFDIRQNIRGGVRYFHYLYGTVYKNSKDRLRKSVAAYNAGPGNVPSNESFHLELYGPETKRIVPCVERGIKNKTLHKILPRTSAALLLFFILSSPLWFYDEIVEPVRDAMETAADSRLAAIMSIARNESVRNTETPDRLPAVLFDAKRDQLKFFDRTGKLAHEASAKQIRHDLKPPADMAEFDTLHIDSEVLQSPDGAFYFFAATSYWCGANNCTWALYRLNADREKIQLVGKDFDGSSSFYPSPDGSKLAVVRFFHAGTCYNGDYLTVVNLNNFQKRELETMSNQENYGINSIESLAWSNNQEIIVHTLQYDRPGCPIETNRHPRKETKTITLAAP